MNFLKNLKTSIKMAIILCSFACPILALLYFLIETNNEAIIFAEKEFTGNAYQKSLEKILQEVLNYKIIMAKKELDTNRYVFERIDEGFADLLNEQKKLEAGLLITDANLQIRNHPELKPELIHEKWNTLKKQTNINVLAELIQNINDLITYVGNSSNLILDPDLDSYYLMDITLCALPAHQTRIAETITFLVEHKNKPLSQDDKVYLALAAKFILEADLARITNDVTTAVSEDANFYGVSKTLKDNISPAQEKHKNLLEPWAKKINIIASESGGSIDQELIATGENVFTSSFAYWEVSAKELDHLLQTRIAALTEKKHSQLIITFAALFSSIILTLYLMLLITRPIKQSLQVLQSMTFNKNNLTQETKSLGKDELANMCQSINEFLTKMQQTVQAIMQSAVILKSSSSELNSEAVSIEESMLGIKDNCNVLVNTGKNLAQQLTTMSTQAESITSSIVKTASALGETHSSIQDVAKNCAKEAMIVKNADAQASKTKELIVELEQSALEIGNFVQIISEIAEQTSLLALNASIEAARAGESGRGFAVVATEVKQLARKSAEATAQISQQVVQIQQRTKKSSAAIEDIVAVISEVLQISISIACAVEEQTATVQEAAGVINTVSQSTQDLSKAIKVVESNSAEGSESIQDLNKKIQSITAIVSDSKTKIEKLANISQQLYGLGQKF